MMYLYKSVFLFGTHSVSSGAWYITLMGGLHISYCLTILGIPWDLVLMSRIVEFCRVKFVWNIFRDNSLKLVLLCRPQCGARSLALASGLHISSCSTILGIPWDVVLINRIVDFGWVKYVWNIFCDDALKSVLLCRPQCGARSITLTGGLHISSCSTILGIPWDVVLMSRIVDFGRV